MVFLFEGFIKMEVGVEAAAIGNFFEGEVGFGNQEVCFLESLLIIELMYTGIEEAFEGFIKMEICYLGGDSTEYLKAEFFSR